MILVKIEGVQGSTDLRIQGYSDGKWFVADSLSFGIDRELSESGEQGGTEDINIGVGELSTVKITKSLDRATPLLAKFAVNGNSVGVAEIHIVSGGNRPRAMMIYKLDRTFVKSWSMHDDGGDNDDPDEAVELYFNRIAFVVAGQPTPFSWNVPTNTAWNEHGLPTLPAQQS